MALLKQMVLSQLSHLGRQQSQFYLAERIEMGVLSTVSETESFLCVGQWNLIRLKKRASRLKLAAEWKFEP